MRGFLANLAPVFHLTRVTIGFGGVANVWFIILWSRALEPERTRAPAALLDDPLWLELAGGALYAAALFAFATALNDLVDQRRDRALHPERPIPAGKLTTRAVSIIAGASLALSIIGASIMGWPAIIMAVGTAGAATVFNFAAKFVPPVGLVLLGLLYGAQMMTANVHLAFVWPVWVALTHALAVGALSHGPAGRRPVITARVRTLAVAGWAFWSGILIFVGWWRAGLWPGWVEAVSAAPVVLTGLVFLMVARQVRKSEMPGTAKGATIQRLGALWLPLYGIGWMLGQGLAREGLILGVLALAGLLGMTVLREVYELVERPLGYRR